MRGRGAHARARALPHRRHDPWRGCPAGRPRGRGVLRRRAGRGARAPGDGRRGGYRRPPAPVGPAAGALVIIDLHAHVLPGVDDGPDTIEECVAAVAAAAEVGVTTLATTPHVRSD